MKITRKNYEAYFLDYLEGNLDNEFIDNFIEFLSQNPDLKEELQMVASVKLKAEPLLFERKESLYKDKYDLPENFNDAAIAFIEGEFSDERNAEFEAYLSRNPLKQKDLTLFKKTQLQPDNTIMFHRKSRLYHPIRRKKILLWGTRIAAVIAITLLIYRLGSDFNFRKNIIENQLISSEYKEEIPASQRLPKNSVKKENLVAASDEIADTEKTKGTDFQSEKNISESNNRQVDLKKDAPVRPVVYVPNEIPSLYATLQPVPEVHTFLVSVNPRVHKRYGHINEERLLGDIVREKTGLDNLSMRKVARVGLNMISSISREKFRYETNSDGQVTELNYDSRLLAFSIPTQ